MSLINKTELNAKKAARRFSKGIVCRIITGAPMVSFMVQEGIIPKNIQITNPEIAFASARSRVFVIPVYNFPELIEAARYAGINMPNKDNQSTQADPEPVASGLLDSQRTLRRQEPLIKFLKQNVIMVAIQRSSIPKGILKSLFNQDVLIDSIDSSQAVYGDLIYRNSTMVKDYLEWDK